MYQIRQLAIVILFATTIGWTPSPINAQSNDLHELHDVVTARMVAFEQELRQVKTRWRLQFVGELKDRSGRARKNK